MKTLYEIKLRKARIDAEREANGLAPAYAAYEKEQPPKKKRTKSTCDLHKLEHCPVCWSAE